MRPPPEHAAAGRPDRPGVSWWARAASCVPNTKFDRTREVYASAGLATTAEHQARIAAANVEFVYRYYATLERLRHTASRRRLQASVDDCDAQALHDALGVERGVVLLSVHLGDFDVAGSWIAQVLGREVVVITGEVAQAARQRWFDDVRRSSGVLLRRTERTRLADVETDLRRGRVVLFMLDRVTPGPTVEGSLLGSRARITVAPYVVARRTGAPIVCGATTTAPDGRRLLSARSLEGDAAASRDTMRLMETSCRILGEQIRSRPWQWHVPADARQLPFVADAVPGEVPQGDVADGEMAVHRPARRPHAA